MTLTKKQKVGIGSSVGVVLALAIGITLYFVLKPKPSPPTPPTPPTPTTTWTCVNDGQGSTMLLQNNVPCAKYESSAACQSAAAAGTVSCSCPTGQVLEGSNCQNICLSTATWTNNTCTCPAGTQWDGATTCKTVCSPPVTVTETTGAVSGFFVQNGSCTNSATTTGKVPALDTICQQTSCQIPDVCSPDSKFVSFDSRTHSCVAPNKCSGLSYYYSWPDGSNTCPGFTYSLSPTGTTCVPPDNTAIQTACEYSAGGCEAGTVPLSSGEQCTNSGVCRSAGATPSCPSGAVVNTTQCPVAGKAGICYNSSTNQCVPAQYSCTPAQLPCPTGTTNSSTCPADTPCVDSQNNCVGTLVGCRPDFESWTFDKTLNVCSNTTFTTGLTLAVDAASTTDVVTVNAVVPSTYNVPLTNVQFRYFILSTSNHWSGVVSKVQYPTNTKQAILTFYPDQTVAPIPANVPLKLLVLGLVLQNGSWTSSISSLPLSDSNVTTFTLKAAPASCLPLVGFSINSALQLVPQINNLPAMVASKVAVTKAASTLGLSSASGIPLTVNFNFAGAVTPVVTTPYGNQSVSQMFVVLCWTALPPSADGTQVTYTVNKNDTPVYSGPLTCLIDVIDVKTTSGTTFSLQAQTSATCTSPVQYTTCPALEFTGEMCTSIQTGAPSTVNFMIPDPAGPGCIPIPNGSESDAAFYYCAYLKNPERVGAQGNTAAMTLQNIQVPSSGYTQCTSIQPVTTPVLIQDLNEDVDKNGKPTGYCKDVDCNTGFSNETRTAVCSCAGDNTKCANQLGMEHGLPYVTLSNGQSMSAYDFKTGIQGMASFMKNNPKLIF
jgi:hypothetical protein